MVLEDSQVHHQKQGGLSPGNPSGDLVGGAVGGPASGTVTISGSISAAGGGGGSFPPFPLRAIPVPPGLTSSLFANKIVDLDHRYRVPLGWQRCLNLKTGNIFFKDQLTGGDEEEDPVDDDDDAAASDMSRRGKTPKLDLRLNLSTAYHRGSSSETAPGRRAPGNNTVGGRSISPHGSSSSSSSSPSSCLSSETDQGRPPSSPEATSMVLVGCPRCLMYVMLSEDDPRCPKCKSTVLLDFLRDPSWNPAAATGTTKKSRKN
ncbi:hypothetical protein Taro_040959 [Colocasia esculenta]|uniref:GIR1-like zinc ribbon domain-containing protein n=1 Tax=Colocasia esculenta TaxID=4460 RepID=A0A843WZI2_COLES|nr:hypothetical protein [Colocasia esculenta]